MIDLFVMQSKTEDEIFGRILSVLLEIKDEKENFLKDKEENSLFLELFYSIILESWSLLKIFKLLLSDAIKCHLSILWIPQTLYVYLFAYFCFILSTWSSLLANSFKFKLGSCLVEYLSPKLYFRRNRCHLCV